jgi:hypothetical protein
VRLLLDCHIAKGAIAALRQRHPSLQAEHLAGWRGGAFLRASDEDILAACHSEQRVFVTFDQRTIPDLLRIWAAEQRAHSGLIFGDKNTVRPDNPGAVAAAIGRLASELGHADTTNLIRFLRPPKAGN